MPITKCSLWRPTLTFTSVTHALHGSAEPTKIQTVYSANIFQKGLICLVLAKRI